MQPEALHCSAVYQLAAESHCEHDKRNRGACWFGTAPAAGGRPPSAFQTCPWWQDQPPTSCVSPCLTTHRAATTVLHSTLHAITSLCCVCFGSLLSCSHFCLSAHLISQSWLAKACANFSFFMGCVTCCAQCTTAEICLSVVSAGVFFLGLSFKLTEQPFICITGGSSIQAGVCA